MSNEKPTIASKSPVLVELEAGKTYFYCTCGKSKNQPFCDGAHSGTSFTPTPFTAEKSGKAALCACKHTANAPYCDGAHKEL
jgi:CDGSH-type Zn-finger protein